MKHEWFFYVMLGNNAIKNALKIVLSVFSCFLAQHISVKKVWFKNGKIGHFKIKTKCKEKKMKIFCERSKFLRFVNLWSTQSFNLFPKTVYFKPIKMWCEYLIF